MADRGRATNPVFIEPVRGVGVTGILLHGDPDAAAGIALRPAAGRDA